MTSRSTEPQPLWDLERWGPRGTSGHMLSRAILSLIPLFGYWQQPAMAAVTEKTPFSRVSDLELAVAPAAALGNLILLLTDPPAETRWKGGILFDGPARSLLRLDSRSGRDTASKIGDLMLYSLVAYPTVVDAALDAGLDKKDTSKMADLAFANSQAFLLTGLTMLLVKRIAARDRPSTEECARDPGYASYCGSPDGKASFYSGHAAFSFTAAGLICAHHKGLDLWGGMTPCYVSLGAALIVGLTRILADRHYASDVLVGAAAGWLYGYVLTRATRYRGAGGGTTQSTSALYPSVQPGGVGLSLAFGF